MERLFCFGDLCVDIVGRTSGDGSGSDVTLEQLSIRPAGAAVNCAVAAAAEGANVEMLGLVGDDDFGALVLGHLEASGVGTEHVRKVKGRTGTVISIVGPQGQTKLHSYRGVNAAVYGPLPDCRGLVYVSGYSFQDSASRETAEALVACGSQCAVDTSYQFARDFRGGSLNVEFLLPNLEEARLMTGRSSAQECCAALQTLGVKNVVVKLGGEGCCVNGELVRGDAVVAVDTTGAGDAFAGAFLASLRNGLDVIGAARRANTVAGELVGRQR